MNRYMMLVLFAAAASLIGCSTLGSKKNSGVDYAREAKRLEKQLSRKKSEIEDLKHKNMILSSKLQKQKNDEFAEAAPEDASRLPVAPFPDKPENRAVIAGDIVKPVSAAAELTRSLPKKSQINIKESKSSADLGEQMIYSKIIDTYRMREVTEMKKSVQILLKAYPDSVYADNALFLSGSLAFETGDFPLARLQMERLIKEFPQSNKVVSALLAKAILDRRENNNEKARASLLMIQKKYPGSPEAHRVAMELKLLDFTASKNKRRES